MTAMMLGRTAANLFWLSRYVERAENMARLLEAGYRMSLVSRRDGSGSEHLVSMLQAAGGDELFFAQHQTADLRSVAHFMLLDPENPSSVYSCFRNARTNARSERTALTSDMWECINSSWLEIAQIKPSQITEKQLPDLVSWVKQSSHRFRGALLGTVLRNDGFIFSQLGNFSERADNTARILDMKYYVLLPRSSFIGGDVDIQQWTFILRAASAYSSYRHTYHDRFKAWNIADYLILRPEMPRSLMFCAAWLRETLEMLEDNYGERSEAHEVSDRMCAMLEGNDMDQVFRTGLHEFLTQFIGCNNALTNALAESYNFY